MEEVERFQQGEVTVLAWVVMVFRSLWNSGCQIVIFVVIRLFIGWGFQVLRNSSRMVDGSNCQSVGLVQMRQRRGRRFIIGLRQGYGVFGKRGVRICFRSVRFLIQGFFIELCYFLGRVERFQVVFCLFYSWRNDYRVIVYVLILELRL